MKLPLINYFPIKEDIRILESHYQHTNTSGYSAYLRSLGWNAVEKQGSIIVNHVEGAEPDESRKPTNRHLLSKNDHPIQYIQGINAHVGKLLRSAGFICVGPYYKREYISPFDHVQSLIVAVEHVTKLPINILSHLRWTWDIEWYEDKLWLVPLAGRRFLTEHDPSFPTLHRWMQERLVASGKVKGIDLNTGKHRSLFLKENTWGTEIQDRWQPLNGKYWRVCLDMETLEDIGYSADAFHSAQFTFDKLHQVVVDANPFNQIVTTTIPCNPIEAKIGVIDGNSLHFSRGTSRDMKDVHRLGILQPPSRPVRLLVVVSDKRLQGEEDVRDILAAHLVERSLLTAHPTAEKRLKSVSVTADNDTIATIWSSNRYRRGFGLPHFSLAKTKMHFFNAVDGKLLDPTILEEEVIKANQNGETLIALVLLDDDMTKPVHDQLMSQFRRMRALPLLASNLRGGNNAFPTWVNLTLSIAQKAGAVPWDLIALPGVDEHTIFVGIDLGHNHERNRSQIAFTLFNYQGRPVNQWVVPCSRNDERIRRDVLFELTRFISEGNRPMPTQVIIHRDGRYLDGECNDLIEALHNMPRLSLVAVKKDTCSRLSKEQVEGTFIELDERRAILVTNIQSNRSSMPAPLEVELMHSNCLSLRQVTSQVFWLTRVYQGNAYFPKRLPVTTGLANNIAGTGNRIHLTGWEYT